MTCHNCKDRKSLCHMECERYRAFQEECRIKNEYLRKHCRTIQKGEFEVIDRRIIK